MTRVILWAPSDYWELTPDQRKKICNGCGTKSTWWIPDTIWFLDITPACNIHDFMYAYGITEKDREQADRVFLNNIVRLIRARTKNRLLAWLRRHRAKIYYDAVRLFGGVAFWGDKNKITELEAIEC